MFWREAEVALWVVLSRCCYYDCREIALAPGAKLKWVGLKPVGVFWA